MTDGTLTLLISTTFALGYVARLAKLPPLVGFIAAGFMLHVCGLRSSPLLETFAHLGVTLLMFSIGLKLEISSLARRVVWLGASGHMLLTTVVAGAFALSLGVLGLPYYRELTVGEAALLGFALSFSSTVFALKVLEARNETTSGHGRLAIGTLIMQDLLAVVFLVLAAGETPSLWAVLVLLLIPARPLLGRLLERAGHGELLLVAGIFFALVVGVDGFSAVGLKADLGALCVGIALGQQRKAKELAESLWGVKELLLVGFFLQIGLSHPVTADALFAAALLLPLLPLKVALYWFVFIRSRLTARTSTLGSLLLANFSEFGLIVAAFGVSAGLLEGYWLVALALAVALSFLAASPVNALAELIFERVAPRLVRFETQERLPEDAPIGLENVEFLVIGLGRVGRGAYQAVQRQHPGRVRGVDYDPGRVEVLAREGIDAVAGDAHDADFWNRVRPDKALRAVLLATSSPATNRFVAEILRRRGFSGKLVAAVDDDDQIEPLTSAGVDSAHNVMLGAGVGLADALFEQLESSGDRTD
jgi:glutathione-regulated potassium-efflux system ancillary protein KefC